MTDNELTHAIIGAAIEVHRTLGPGLLESAMGRVVVELKAVEAFAPVHDAIVLTYLRLSGCRIGLLINFNVAVLKDGIRRFLFDPERYQAKSNTEIAEAQRSQRSQR